jgi:hypothetical protein
MTNDFTIITAQYDGTWGGSGDPDPLVSITGAVNGKNVFPWVFFAYLAAANAARQMQAALTAVMYNWYAGVYRAQLFPQPDLIALPTFPLSTEVAQQIQGPHPQPDISYSPALIAPWSA